MSARNFKIDGTKTRYGTVTIRREENKVVVQLHSTDIVTFDKTLNTIVLNSGGWHTVTTKQAMNIALGQILGFPRPFVRQTKGNWFIDVPGAKPVEFFDGITIGGVK